MAPWCTPVKNSVGLGIGLTSLAYMAFTFHDAIVKILIVSIPVWQILFFRSLTILTGCLIFGGGQLIRQTVTSPIGAELTSAARIPRMPATQTVDRLH